MNSNFNTFATAINVQELVERVMQGVSGTDIAAIVDPQHLADDVSACINKKVSELAGVAA